MSRLLKLFTAILGVFICSNAEAQFREEIDHLVNPGGTAAFNIDEEINVYVQGPADIEYLSYPENEQPRNLTPGYSQDNPKIIYDNPEDMEVEPDPEQCPATVMCPEAERDPDFQYQMELEDPLDYESDEDI